MTYAKQIINKEDTDDNDLKVITRYINDYISYREFKGNPVKTGRNECFNESIELNRYLNSRRVRSYYVKGFFVIEDLSGMRLTMADLYSNEVEEFIEYISKEFEEPEKKPEHELVYAFAMHKGESDFKTYPHAWVEINGIMIDMTAEQFEKACPSGITKLNYIRG